MYRLNIAEAQEKVIDALNEGKEAVILSPTSKNSEILKPVGEHISIVRDIRVDTQNKGMSILTLQFKNKTVDTHAYIDSSIKVGSVVSTIGFLTDNGLISSYYTKGGINAVNNYLYEIDPNDFAPNKVLRLGVVFELSNVTAPTKIYNKNDKKVQKLENVKDFYYVIEEMETPKDDIATKYQNIVDKVRNGQPSTEDYPDEDTPIGVGENDNQ